MQKWAQKQTGFTIVELLIVIVVIAILAAITIVAFNGVQQNSRNTARVSEAKEWEKILLAYKSAYGEYPSVGIDSYCLGTGYADINADGRGDCWDAWPSAGNMKSENTTLNSELKKVVSTFPNATRTPIAGSSAGTSRIGPAYEANTNRIIYWLEGNTGGCPIGSARWNDAASRACQIQLQ